MSVSKEKSRYIPFRKKDVKDMILEDIQKGKEIDEIDFIHFFDLIESIFHFDFHKDLEALKDVYYPINPDLRGFKKSSENEINKANELLLLTLRKVLNDANYDVISKQEIEESYDNSALVGISIDIDLSDYEFIEIYSRGERIDSFQVKKFFGLIKKQVEHRILERVLLIARMKPDKESLIDPDKTIVKLFKDVPLEDLEILFPTSKVVMSMRDKLMLAIPAIAAGIPLLMTKVVPAFIVAFVIISAYFGFRGTVEEDQLKQAVAVFSAMGALGGYIFKQISKYKSKRFHFQKELSDNLYFRNLVNNAGVFYSLIDSAEEEEFKEAVLAYYFLLKSHNDLNEEQLDKEIEQWFQVEYGCNLDFECSDALAKLKRLDLLINSGHIILKVIPIKDALQTLDHRWDNYFTYNQEI